MHRSLLPIAVPAAVSCGFAAYAYFADRTGVTGTEGALLALIGAGAVMLGSFVAGFTARRGAAFATLAVLIGLGAALTALAGFFLMQVGLTVAMMLTLVGLGLVLMRPATMRMPV